MNSLPLQLIHWRYYQKGLRGRDILVKRETLKKIRFTKQQWPHVNLVWFMKKIFEVSTLFKFQCRIGHCYYNATTIQIMGGRSPQSPRPPKTYESNFIYHDFIQFRKNIRD